ncbi:MAG: amino acid ABC transporter substrate-binding protein [Desulfobacula sp.]|nr:amino acid ABC transporter substrate-binding protein [Desulfobacula sp.]
MNKIFKIILLFMIVSIALPIYSTVASEQSVIIGIPLPLSGNLKEFGTMMKNSFEMAKTSINKAGGINGLPIKIVFADDRGKVASVKPAFNQLIAAKPVMLVGGYASGPTYQMAKLAENKKLPFLICTASADKITQKGWKNIYRLNPPISEYTKGLKDFFASSINPASMSIIYENSMFGTNGAMSMAEYCQDQAIEIKTLIGYDKTKITPAYFRSLLAPLTQETPDVIYMISYLEDAVMLVDQIRNLKLKSLLCGGAGGFTLDEFVKRAGTSANNLLTVSLWSKNVPYTGAKEYYIQYVKRYKNSPDYHGAEAYSALLVAADALKRTTSFTTKNIRDALNQTYIITPFAPVKFYSYYDFERQNSINTLVLQIINGKFETIWPPNFASAKFKLP